MPFNIKFDKPSLHKIASLCGILIAFLLILRISMTWPITIRQTIFLTVLLYAPIHLLNHRYIACRRLTWLPALVALFLFLFPGKQAADAGKPAVTAVSLPRNADAVRVLRTNIQQVQNTLLIFCADVRRFLFMGQNVWAWALLLTTLIQVFGKRLKRWLFNKAPARWFEPLILLLDHLPDRLARYIAMETLLFFCLACGWGIALYLMAFPSSLDLALLFGLGGLTPTIGMLWAAGLTLFFLPWGKGAWAPTMGLTISFAVLWLSKHFFLNRHLHTSRPQTHTPLILAGFLIGLVFAGYAGSFYAVPVFFISMLFSFYVQEIWRMLHPDRF